LKFGQLTLGKILKIVATRCQILSLKCTKFKYPIAGLRGLLLRGLRGGDGKGRGREGEGISRGRDERRPNPFTPPNPFHAYAR